MKIPEKPGGSSRGTSRAAKASEEIEPVLSLHTNSAQAVTYMIDKPVFKPAKRTAARYRAAVIARSSERYLAWLFLNHHLARERSDELLPYSHFRHETVLLRLLQDVDMVWQHNKIQNLRLAVRRLDGMLVRPGQTLSYWRCIGRPTYRKGYVDGVVLQGGRVGHGCGGGLCQLSNLIYWMTLHTALTVTERHRHGYDVFPDSSRTQPFGSGATCFYPYGDLMIKNETPRTFQLCVRVGDNNLEGAWRSDAEAPYRYEIVEKNHHFNGEYWGGFSRHNELYRRVYAPDGVFVGEEFMTENHALTMYAPLLEDRQTPC